MQVGKGWQMFWVELNTAEGAQRFHHGPVYTAVLHRSKVLTLFPAVEQGKGCVWTTSNNVTRHTTQALLTEITQLLEGF